MNPLSLSGLGSGVTARLSGYAQQAGLGGRIPTADLDQLAKNVSVDQAPTVGRVGGTDSTFGGTDTFSSLLGDLVNGTTQKQATATDAVNGLYAGQAVPLHQAMIASEEASISFQLMVEVRNKLLESYQELMRMQV